MNDYQDHSPSTSTDFSEKEKMEMLESWFQRRAEMTSKALKLILIPVVVVLLFAAIFWFSYYIPIPAEILLGLLGAALLAWLICLFIGGGILKRVRTGDSIMLRKIRSSESSPQS